MHEATHHVHIYHIVRSKYEVVACNHIEAIRAAGELFDQCSMGQNAIETESAEEVTGYLVDVLTDTAHENTKSFGPDGESPDPLHIYFVKDDDGNGDDRSVLCMATDDIDALKIWRDNYELEPEDVPEEVRKLTTPIGRGLIPWS